MLEGRNGMRIKEWEELLKGVAKRKDVEKVKRHIEMLSKEVRSIRDGMRNGRSSDELKKMADEIAELKGVITSIASMVNSNKEEGDTSTERTPEILKTTISAGTLKANTTCLTQRQTKYAHKQRKKLDGLKQYSSGVKNWENMGKKNDKNGLVSFTFVQASSKEPANYAAGPFKLQRQMDDMDARIIRYIFDESLSENEILVRFPINELSRKTMGCLKPSAWLDGEVICAVGEMLMHDEKIGSGGAPQEWYFPTRFAQVVLCTNLDFLSFVHDHRWIERYIYDFGKCSKIHIPVLDSNANHWILMVVDIVRKRVEIWDSYPQQSFTEGRVVIATTLLKALDTLIAELIRIGLITSPMNFAKYSVVLKYNAARQTNGDDCGLFVVKYMQEGSRYLNPNLKMNSDASRCALAMQLAKSNMNTNRRVLSEMADTFM